MIKVEHLTKRYGTIPAVEDVSFTVEDGGICGLLGPNGAGKSTMMNIITGYLSATSGSVTVNGHDILEEPKEAKACIGYLPEQPPLYPEMTVREYLLFVSELKGEKKKAERIAAVEKISTRVGLKEMMQRQIRSLSKGYKQRVGIAGALLGNPQIIILDEPMVGLDPAQMIEVRSLIKELGKSHTVILSSHILSEVQAVCDRVLIIAHGKLAAQGTPEELAGRLAAQGSLTVTAMGESEKVLKIAKTVEGVIEVHLLEENAGEVHFTVTVQGQKDLRGELSLALANAGCPVLAVSAEQMSLEDVFLQFTEEKGETDSESNL